MKFIAIERLIVPEKRQRKAFDPDHITKLEASIASKGLAHAVVLQNDEITLVAGECRLRSISNLHLHNVPFTYNGEPVPRGYIPYTILADLSPFAVRELELEENDIRLNLSWAERAAAIADLHTLRQEQATAEGKSHTVTQTASEIIGTTAKGSNITGVQEALLVAGNLHIPAVAAAKSQKEAVKVLRAIKETEHRAKLAAAIDSTSGGHDVRLGDCREVLPLLPAETFDCILTDPPYGVGADGFGEQAGIGHNYADTWEYAKTVYESIAVEGFRITKPQAHLYCFVDFTHALDVSLILTMAGWRVWPRPLIWNKHPMGILPRPEHGPRYVYEMLLFATKGDRRTLAVKPDLITVQPDPDKLHGAQKPVALIADLLSRTCLPSSRVIDPCGGSGPLLAAATSLKCFATVIESSEHNYNIALQRLATPSADTLNISL